jgi:hypothetical protein
MRATIKGISRELLVQTVSVSRQSNVTPLILVRCYHCGSGISQIDGVVTRIFPGLEPTPNLSVITQCVGCRMLYTFQPHLYKDDRISVTLSTTEKLEDLFYCIICRTLLLQYTDTYVKVLPEREKKQPPFDYDCFKPLCGSKYRLNSIVSTWYDA